MKLRDQLKSQVPRSGGASTPTPLLACHLAGEFGYQDSGAVVGIMTTDKPFPLTANLAQLR